MGATGQALNVELMHAGLVRDTLAIVNATCCQPKLPKKENEMRQAVLACRPAFLHQLAKLDPDTPMLAMGKWAFFALTLKDKGVMKARGFIRWATKVPTVETERVRLEMDKAHKIIKEMDIKRKLKSAEKSQPSSTKSTPGSSKKSSKR